MTEIAKCPYCGGECYCVADGLDDKGQETPPYWIRCKECNYQYGHGIYIAAIAAHNALVEKGRLADELERELQSLQVAYSAVKDNFVKTNQQRNEAVRLLYLNYAHDEYFLYDEEKPLGVKAFLARKDIKPIVDAQKGK